MVLTVTIDGVTVPIDEGSFDLKSVLNGIDRLSCAVTSVDGSVRPAADTPLIVERNSVRLFGGLIESPVEAGFQDVGLEPITTRINAQDYNVLPTLRHVTLTIPAGTLKAALLLLVPYLAPFGTTLDPAQVDGPLLPELVYRAKLLSEVFADLEEKSRYLRDISSTNVLGMYAVGTEVAPFDVTDSNGVVDGDISVQPGNGSYANHVYLLCGPLGTQVVTQVWTVAPAETEWEVDIQATRAGWQRGVIRETTTLYGVVDRTISPPGQGGYYYWDDTDGKGTISVGAGSAPAGGSTLEWIYAADFPFLVEAEDVPAPDPADVREITVEDASITTYAAGLVRAQSELALRLAGKARIVKYATYADGLRKGQVQTITSALRHFTGACLITEVDTRDVFGLMGYSVTAIEGTLFQGSWRDVYKAMFGGGGGSSTGLTVSTGGTSSLLLSLPAPVKLGGSLYHMVRVME
jgi:hypothetical protein